MPRPAESAGHRPGAPGHVSLASHPHCRVSHILNMAREIDNFYPDRFIYHNVRLWDEESAQLLPHWKETHSFVEAARSGCPHPLCPPHLRFRRSPALLLATLALGVLPAWVSLLPALPPPAGPLPARGQEWGRG